MKNSPSRKSQRRGGATIEFAISLPLLLIVIFGAIDICERIFFKQSVSLVAYEGARLAARRSATSANVIARCQQMMQERRIDNGEIILSPSSIDNLPPTTPITLTIRATRSTFGMGQYSSEAGGFQQTSGTVTGTSTMLRE
jgi:Flp pilus assembly protein TadG